MAGSPSPDPVAGVACTFAGDARVVSMGGDRLWIMVKTASNTWSTKVAAVSSVGVVSLASGP